MIAKLSLKRRQSGLSLIELMIGLLAGTIVIGGITSVYLSTLTSSASTLQRSKLTQELMAIMNVMSNDIRRAGIWRTADLSAPQDNPFSEVGNTDLAVLNYNSGTNNCVVYAYDHADDGANPVNADMRGFRYNSTDKSIEMREVGDLTKSSQANCADTHGTWYTMNDYKVVEITTLTFSTSGATCLNASEPNNLDDDSDGTVDNAAEKNCASGGTTPSTGDMTIEAREVLITLTGRLAGDTDVTANVSQTVRVRNDLVRVH